MDFLNKHPNFRHPRNSLIWLPVHKNETGFYVWNDTESIIDNELFPVDEHKAKCADDCCNLLFDGKTGLVYAVKCLGSDVARSICFIPIFTETQAIVDLIRNRIKEQMALTKQLEETIREIEMINEINERNRINELNDYTSGYVLFGLFVVGILAVGHLTFFIFRTVREEGLVTSQETSN